MKAFLLVMVIFMALVLIALFVLAWMYDVQSEKFRNELKPGMPVSYSQGYFLYNGIVTEVMANEVKLVDGKTQALLTVPKHKIYQR